MIKFVLVASLLLISHVFADDATCSYEDYKSKKYHCDILSVDDVYQCKRFGRFLYDYKWTKVEECKFCCFDEKYGGHCLYSVEECAKRPTHPEDPEEVKQVTCNVQKTYNRFRRE